MSSQLNIGVIKFPEEVDEALESFRRLFGFKLYTKKLNLDEAIKSKDYSFYLIGQPDYKEAIDLAEFLREKRCFTPAILCTNLPNNSIYHSCEVSYARFFPRPLNSFNLLKMIQDDYKMLLNQKKEINILERIWEQIDHKQLKSALQTLKQLREICTNETSNRIYAQILFKAGNTEKALETLNKSLKKEPNQEGHILKSEIMLKKNRGKEAVQFLNKCIEREGEKFSYLLAKANIFFAIDDIAKANKYYKMSLQIRRKSPSAFDGLISTLLISGNMKAISKFIGSENVSSVVARVCNQKGIELSSLGHYRQAEKLYLNVLQQIEDKSIIYKFYLNLGLCMKKAGVKKKALEYFEKCDKIAPDGYLRAKEQIFQLKKIEIQND